MDIQILSRHPRTSDAKIVTGEEPLVSSASYRGNGYTFATLTQPGCQNLITNQAVRI
jgi:hypothetical protein